MKAKTEVFKMLFHRKPQKRVLELSQSEIRYARNALMHWYNKLVEEGKPTEDVAALIKKFMK